MTEFGPRPGARDTLERAGVLGGPPKAPPTQKPPSTGPEREFTIEARSQTRTIVRRFMHHKLAVASLIVLGVITLFAFVGPHFWPYDAGVAYAEQGTVFQLRDANGNIVSKTVGGPSFADPPRCHGDFSNPNGKGEIPARARDEPCAPHLFGVDTIGRDMVAEIMRGSQKSLSIALVVAFIATLIGVVVGAISGYFGGRADAMLMRGTDLFLTIPLIAVAGTLSHHVRGGQWWFLAIILAGLGWMPIARVIRGEILSLREKEFIEAAHAIGASDKRIIFRHILPNVIGSIIVNATLVVALAILLETALSYLGLGVKPPDTSLGLLISDNQTAFSTRPWLFWFPALFIILIVMAINFVGDGLRDAFDPRQTRVRA